MHLLLEFAPLLAFFLTYYIAGIYTATAVLMVAMAAVLVVDYIRERRIPPMHGLSAVLIFAFGAATLVLHDRHFIQLKATVFYWIAALAFLGSFWIGQRTLAERMLGAAFSDHAQVPPNLWRRLNGMWVAFAVALGGLNLLIASYASERVWVYCKAIGLPVLTLIFIGAQVTWLMRRSDTTQAEPSA